MPIERLIFILVLVIAFAAATVALALTVVDVVNVSPMVGLAILSLTALFASIAWRRFSDDKRDTADTE